MDDNQETTRIYLNRDNVWRDFRSAGLDLLPNGAWQLAALPRRAGETPLELNTWPEPDGLAGLAVDLLGSIYYSMPETNYLCQIGACDDEAQMVPLPAGGTLPGRLHHPRGLLYHAARQTLLVADSSNSRIQLFDTQTWQVVEIWGRAGVPGAAPWHLRVPVALAADAAGSVYVVDHPTPEASSAARSDDGQDDQTAAGAGGAGHPPPEYRVLKFDRLGRPVPAFGQKIRGAAFERPIAIAVGTLGGKEYLYVLDLRAAPLVVVLDTAGNLVTQLGAGRLGRPLAIAVDSDGVYVGDNTTGHVLVFKPVVPPQDRHTVQFAYAGTALGYRGPIAALVAGAVGELWLHPGVGSAESRPLLLASAGGYASSGVLWGGPFGTDTRRVRWHRLKAELSGLAEGSHAQFFVCRSQDPAKAPAVPDLTAVRPFAEPDWQALPLDVADGLVPFFTEERVEVSKALSERNSARLIEPTYLWIGVHMSSEGSASPVLDQAWINYDHGTYRQYLPSIFSRDPDQVELLDQLLSLFESFYNEVEGKIRGLDQLFDAQGTPTSWLSWLASWLALNLDASWPEAQQRGAIQVASANYGKRGTTAGLLQALRDFATVDAHLDEPITGAAWWALAPDDDVQPAVRQAALLGFGTVLAPNHGEGAVLGSTAVLDSTSLIGEEDYGGPLFENIAHRFTVQVYRGQVRCAADLDRVRAVIEREKPAHTAYQVCVIEPRMRVGFQARLGIDSVVAGPLPPTPLDGTGERPVLGGDPPGRVGGRLSQTTRLA